MFKGHNVEVVSQVTERSFGGSTETVQAGEYRQNICGEGIRKVFENGPFCFWDGRNGFTDGI